MKSYEPILKSIVDSTLAKHDVLPDIGAEPAQDQEWQLCFEVYTGEEIEITYSHLVSNFDRHFSNGGQKAPYREIILVARQQLNGQEFVSFWWAEMDYSEAPGIARRVRSGIYNVPSGGAHREVMPEEEAELMHQLKPIAVGLKLGEGNLAYRRFNCTDDRYQSHYWDIETIRGICFGKQEHDPYYWEGIPETCAA